MIRVRRYGQDGTVQESVEPDEVSECLTRRGSLLWVDVDDPTEEDVALLTREFDFHHLAAEDLLEPTLRPRLSRFAGHHLLVVHDPCLIEGRFASREIDLLFGEEWLISVRKGPADGGGGPPPLPGWVTRFEQVRTSHGATDAGFLLYAILDTVVARCFAVSDELEDHLDDIEADIFADESGPKDQARINQRLYELRSDLVQFRRTVAPLREAIAPLLRDPGNHLGDVAEVYLRDVLDLAIRVVESVESQKEVLNGAIEAHLSIASNRMNLVMKRATSWGAILVVATLVASVYGMNFKHMPELQWRFGYAYALGLIGGITLTLYLMFKRRDWL